MSGVNRERRLTFSSSPSDEWIDGVGATFRLEDEALLGSR